MRRALQQWSITTCVDVGQVRLPITRVEDKYVATGDPLFLKLTVMVHRDSMMKTAHSMENVLTT